MHRTCARSLGTTHGCAVEAPCDPGLLRRQGGPLLAHSRGAGFTGTRRPSGLLPTGSTIAPSSAAGRDLPADAPPALGDGCGDRLASAGDYPCARFMVEAPDIGTWRIMWLDGNWLLIHAFGLAGRDSSAPPGGQALGGAGFSADPLSSLAAEAGLAVPPRTSFTRSDRRSQRLPQPLERCGARSD